jgi:hypothetical protein
MRRLVSVGIVFSALVLASGRAYALFDISGSIQANAAAATINLDELSFSAPGTFAVGAADPLGPVSAMSHPALDLYSLSGDIATLVATSTSTIIGTAQISAPVNAGTYLFAVSEAPLTPGNFGPLNTAAANSASFAYDADIGGALGNETTLVCDYTGNLGGTFNVNSGCQNPPAFTYQVAVPEPSSAALSFTAMAALVWLRTRYKSRNRGTRREKAA